MKNHYELLKQNFLRSIDNAIYADDLLYDDTYHTDFMKTASEQGLTDGAIHFNRTHIFILSYYLKDSPYYRDPTMLERCYRNFECYESFIHEDGTLDLLTTNFHDPAQTGFHMQAVFFITELIYRFTEHTELEDKLYDKILAILRKCGNAMATLGFHTPNHRWVISSGLAIAYRYTKEQKFLDAINGFLKEGIDCDECGEYTERSTGSYNIICDYSFSIMAFALEDDSYYEYIRRNLKLMFSYLEPDLTVNTLNSTRWDNGGEYNIAPYYPHYLLLALIDNDPEFAYMADLLIDKYGILPPYREVYLLMHYMIRPELLERQNNLQSIPPKKDQTRFLPNSRIARIYKPDCDMTMTALCSRIPVFFQMNYGSSVLQVRFAASFFGDPHSAFRPKKIIPIEDGYKLIGEESAGYRSQFDEKPETSNWRQMDHSKRHIINVQTLRVEISVHILEDGVTFDIDTFGCERVPTKFEIAMMPGGRLFAGNLMIPTKAGEYFFLADGGAKYFIDALRYFEIEGGVAKHYFGEHMRGTTPPNPKKFTIAITNTTPQHNSITIRARKLGK